SFADQRRTRHHADARPRRRREDRSVAPRAARNMTRTGRTMEMLTAEDRIAIRELLALYGHVIDERQFSRVDELFPPDGRYDVSDFGQGVHHSPAAIAALWADPGSRHPLAPHPLDVVVPEG